MSVREEVERILDSHGRVEEGVTVEAEADIANLRAAVRELQQVAV